MQRVTITRLEKKDGSGAKGPWTKLGIQTDKHADKWLGCFINQYNEKALSALAVGQNVEIAVTTSPDGKYLNFSLPTRTDKLEARVDVLEKKLGITEEEPSQDDINPDDIPF